MEAMENKNEKCYPPLSNEDYSLEVASPKLESASKIPEGVGKSLLDTEDWIKEFEEIMYGYKYPNRIEKVKTFISQQIAKATENGAEIAKIAANASAEQKIMEYKGSIIELLKPVLEINDYKDRIKAWNNIKDSL